MKNVLVTGVSSGIGKTLTELLVLKGFRVWGIARREKLLREFSDDLKSNNFIYTVGDVAQNNFWNNLIKQFKRRKYSPQTVIFNAAINENDLEEGINVTKLRKIMDINFISILEGIKLLTDSYQKIHFITISSTSAFKGNYLEGIGYAASKSALSIAFECLFQKYQNTNIKFTTIFLGPVKTDMIRFTKTPPFTLTPKQVAESVIRVMGEKKPFYYFPKIAFNILKIMRLMPNELFYSIWMKMQKSYIKK